MGSTPNPFNPSQFINIHLLLTVSIQNQLFCCENIEYDHTLQATKYEKLSSPKLFKRKAWISFRRISNTSFVVFGAEKVKKSPSCGAVPFQSLLQLGHTFYPPLPRSFKISFSQPCWVEFFFFNFSPVTPNNTLPK